MGGYWVRHSGAPRVVAMDAWVIDLSPADLAILIFVVVFPYSTYNRAELSSPFIPTIHPSSSSTSTPTSTDNNTEDPSQIACGLSTVDVR